MNWSGLGLQALEFLLPVLASVLTVVLTLLARKWLAKLGVESDSQTDAMIDKWVKIGVDYAEQVAKNKLKAGETVKPEDKMATALQAVLLELDRTGLKNVGEKLLVARIESALSDKKVAEQALTKS